MKCSQAAHFIELGRLPQCGLPADCWPALSRGFVQTVELILQPAEFRLLHSQSIFGVGYRCLYFSFFIRVRIEPNFYFGEGILQVLCSVGGVSLWLFFSSICLILTARLFCSKRT